MFIDENLPPTGMKTAFFCRTCGTALTRFLSEGDERDILFIPGLDIVRPATFIHLGRGWAWNCGESPRQFDGGLPDGGLVLFAAGDYLLRPQDINHRKRPKPDSSSVLASGEANAECPTCGSPIGADHTDPLWPALAFRLMWHTVDIGKI